MLGPDWEQGCPSCSLLADHFDGAVVHLAQRDVAFVVVSRAPLAQIEKFERRMGWHFKWVSSFANDFNYDYHVSATPEEKASGKAMYNYELTEFPSEERPGASVFYKNATGEIFHTYSSYGRGLDILIGAYNFLDIAPKGRDEESLEWSMAWVRHHDRYDGAAVDPKAKYEEPKSSEFLMRIGTVRSNRRIIRKRVACYVVLKQSGDLPWCQGRSQGSKSKCRSNSNISPLRRC